MMHQYIDKTETGGHPKSHLEKGFEPGPKTHQMYSWGGKREDSDGSTYIGNPRERGGFLTRPQGEER